MTKLSLLGVASLAAVAAFAVPAFAQHKNMHPLGAYAQTDTCAYEPGNPHNRVTDFLAWSAYRSRGGWDDRTDFECAPSAMRHSTY